MQCFLPYYNFIRIYGFTEIGIWGFGEGGKEGFGEIGIYGRRDLGKEGLREIGIYGFTERGI